MEYSRDNRSRRRIWLHGGLLFSLAVGTILTWGMFAPTDPGTSLTAGERFEALLYGLLGSLYTVTPLLVGITVGVLRPERGLLVSAAGLTTAAVALMVTIDIFAPPAAPSLNQPALQSGMTVEVSTRPARLEEGAVSTMVGFLGVQQDAVNEVLRSYPPDHPRLSRVKGLVAFLFLFLPPVFVGFNLGVGSWIVERVTFKTKKDERVAQLLLSWTLTPLLFSLVMFFSSRTQAAVLFGGSTPFLILIPAIPLLFLATLGWNAAARA